MTSTSAPLAERTQADGKSVRARLRRASSLSARTRTLTWQDAAYHEILSALLPGRHATAIVVPPVYCDLGCNVEIEEHAIINAGCILLDIGRIRIGSHSIIGPGCRICTPHHPLDATVRRSGKQYSSAVVIGDDCWLGSSVTVCPGVSIGDRSVIAAGSVVISNIPPDSLAAGNPARVIRSLKDGPITSGPERTALARAHTLSSLSLDNFARMRLGLPYDARDSVCQTRRALAARHCARLRETVPGDAAYRAIMKELVPLMDPTACVLSPVHLDFGTGLAMGEHSFINTGATILDNARVRLAAHVLLGPRCHIATPFHPLDAAKRAVGLVCAAPVTIEEDCWLGAGVIVCPGVTVGARSVIGAGSVVTRNIPPDSLACGQPAVVKRTLRTASVSSAHENTGQKEKNRMPACDMTEIQKMRAGFLYNFSDPEIMRSNVRAAAICTRMRTMGLDDPGLRDCLRELIPGFPDSSQVFPPLYCDHGHGVIMGEHVFMNVNCIILDSGMVRIGNHCQIGPDCQFCTPHHPMDYALRRQPVETTLPITIGDDCWLGAGVIICPGVTIGPRSVIAAGSVVIRDIPADSLAAGNPAVVKRRLQPGDRSRLETLAVVKA